MKTDESLSLAAVVDDINESLFFGRPLALAERRRIAKWIANRQGLPGSYRGMPAPTEKDFTKGARLFTGETLRSRAGTAHVLGHEACRALLLLDIRDRTVQAALDRATQGMAECLRRCEAGVGRPWRGEYCCAQCTCGLWRHFTAGGLRDLKPGRWLEAGLKTLRAHRLGNGQWRRYPFFYTLLALGDMDSKAAVAECRYAAPACERAISRLSNSRDLFGRRRRVLAERILSKV